MKLGLLLLIPLLTAGCSSAPKCNPNTFTSNRERALTVEVADLKVKCDRLQSLVWNVSAALDMCHGAEGTPAVEDIIHD